MPLTPIQLKIARLLARNRTPDSHLAGGAALHFAPNSMRYSNDLDYFHDSVERVATAFESDRRELERNGYAVETELSQPGYLRALVSLGKDPGFSPLSLLGLLKRRGRYRTEDFSALMVVVPMDVAGMKVEWLKMLDEAETFIRNAPPDQIGCLYYSREAETFVDPQQDAVAGDIELHYGTPGGVLPRFCPDEPFPGREGP